MKKGEKFIRGFIKFNNALGIFVAEIMAVIGAIFISLIIFKHSKTVLSDWVIFAFGILFIIFSLITRSFFKNKN